MNGREYATSYNDQVDNWRHLSRPRRCRSHRTKVLLKKWEFIPYMMSDEEKEFHRVVKAVSDAAMEKILGSMVIPSSTGQ